MSESRTAHQIILEAHALIGGDDIPLWPVAAALQLGYHGESVPLHVARVILEWHDRYATQADRAPKLDLDKDAGAGL